jgi:hypothetical protein
MLDCKLFLVLKKIVLAGSATYRVNRNGRRIQQWIYFRNKSGK